jgi:hypothetical protein
MGSSAATAKPDSSLIDVYATPHHQNPCAQGVLALTFRLAVARIASHVSSRTHPSRHSKPTVHLNTAAGNLQRERDAATAAPASAAPPNVHATRTAVWGRVCVSGGSLREVRGKSTAWCERGGSAEVEGVRATTESWKHLGVCERRACASGREAGAHSVCKSKHLRCGRASCGTRFATAVWLVFVARVPSPPPPLPPPHDRRGARVPPGEAARTTLQRKGGTLGGG